MVKSYLNQEKLYKIKNISKKIMSPSRKKVIKKSFIWASNKKRLRVYQGIYFSQRIAKKYSWKFKERYSKRIFIAKKRKVFKYTYKHQKSMRALRHMVKSKLPKLFFEPWKKTKLIWTEKQKWLHVTYNKYRRLRLKDRIDFFRTNVGKLLLETELASHVYPQSNLCWLSRRQFQTKLTKKLILLTTKFKQKKLQKQESLFGIKEKLNLERIERASHFHYLRIYFRSKIPVKRNHNYLMSMHRRNWWYENLIQKRKKPPSVKRFLLDRPKTAFQSYWKQQKREPWKDSLLFKRALYSGFGEIMRKENKFRPLKMRFYLRHKNPRYEKRNRLYQRNTKLLANFRQRNRIRADKAARIKQIAGKILRPFYGHLGFKQMSTLVKKSRRIKSKRISRNEIILNHLENRLDVVVYRLNFAPSILWARRLIWGGSIFVTNLKKTYFWDLMYSSLKKFAFPLKLRDPKKLYSQTLWKPHRHLAQYKFLGEPNKKISYLVQPEDIIQCGGGALINNFQSDSILLQKPIPSHLLTLSKDEIFWYMRFQQFKRHSWKEWEQVTDTMKSAVFLHPVKFEDLGPHDRVQESFFRWAIL
jgi:ribosomal protein S4